MKYKMVCVDLDGTLLNSKRIISERNIQALKKASKQGVQVVIATGRASFDAEFYLEKIDPDSYIIAANGALVKNNKLNEVLLHKPMSEDVLKKIIDLSYDNKIAPVFYTENKIYVGGFKNFVMHCVFMLKASLSHHKKIVYLPTKRFFERLISREQGNVHKCILFEWNGSRAEKLSDIIKTIEGVELAWTSSHCFELTATQVTKGSAVSELARVLGIKREEIIAIGDSENDLTMIEFAGLGVAMDNGICALKERADYITLDNDNHGVAQVVEKFILNV